MLRDRRPVRLDSYDELDTVPRPEIADHAALGVPIWWSGQIIGVLGVTAPPPHRFDDEAVAVLSLFAQHAAIAIEVARRFDDERRRSARNAMLIGVGRAVTGSLSLDEILATALATLDDSFHHHTIAVMLVDPDDPDTLVTRARSGVYTGSVPVDQGIAAPAFRPFRATPHALEQGWVPRASGPEPGPVQKGAP